MKENIENIFFSLIRFELGQELSDSERKVIIPDIFAPLYYFSKSFDLVHLIGDALEKNGFLKDDIQARKLFLRERDIAIFRYTKRQYEFEAICKVLSDSEIPFVPIKGVIVQQYYPEPWMRTSCDIDILVHENQADKAADLLVEFLGYKKAAKRDINALSLYSPNDVHLEIHFDLTEGGKYGKIVIENLWDNIYFSGKDNYHIMKNEYLYFYHILHMVKHFSNGGCGVRPFIDLWLLNKKNKCDHSVCNKLFEKSSLLKFANSAETLSKVWFESLEYDQLSYQMKDYICSGAAFGTRKNSIAINKAKKGNRFHYICSRIFISKKELVVKYPILQKHKWLFPFCYIIRLLKPLINKKSRIKSFGVLKESGSITKNENEKMTKLVTELEL